MVYISNKNTLIRKIYVIKSATTNTLFALMHQIILSIFLKTSDKATSLMIRINSIKTNKQNILFRKDINL